MIYEKILVQKNYQRAEFLYTTYGGWVILEPGETKEEAAVKVRQDLDKMFLADNPQIFEQLNFPKSDEELPVTQVKEPSRYDYPVASEDDIVKEIKTYKFGAKALTSIYGEMVKGNTKLEEAYQNKLAELSK